MRILLLVISLLGHNALAQWAGSFGDGPFLNAGLPLAAGITQPTLIRTQTNTVSGTPSSITLSGFDCTGGNYVVVGIAATYSTIRTVSSITTGTGAQTTTNICQASYNTSTGGRAGFWGVVNPTTGDIVVTMSGACTVISATAMLFNNVGGSGSVASGNAATDFLNSNRTSTSDNLTTVTTDLSVDMLAYNATAGAPTKGASQTLIAQTPGTATLAFIADSTQPGASGTTTMSWTFPSQIVTWAGCVLNGK